RTRPIDVGAVLEDYVDKRFPEHRFTANELHFWCGNEFRRDRIGNLIFYQVGRAPFPLSVNDHLHVAKIGYRVERRMRQTVKPSRDSEDCKNEHKEFVPCASLYEPLDERRRRSG